MTDTGTMTATKPWWSSKGVWGGLVAVAAGGAGMFGYHFDAALTADATDWVVAAATVLGGGMSIVGRIRASKVIGSK